MNRSITFGTLASLLLLVLSACGGGEAGQSTGSTGTPSPPPSPSPAPTPAEITLTLSATTISVQAPTIDRGASQTVDLSLLNLPDSTPIYLRGTYTFTGISTAQFEVNGTRVQVLIAFKNPFQTAPGTYSDTIVLHACRDAACVNEIAGSPKTMTINYTVAVPPNPPRIALQANNVSAQAFVLDAGPPTTQVVSAAFSDMGQNTTPFVTLSSTNSAIALASYSQPAGVAGINISIALKPGATLGAGTYTDVVTARACLDQNCVNELAGSPASITVHYTVNNTIMGPNGYTVKPVAANATDMVWDPTRQVFYVSIPSTSSTNANSIGVLNPLTGLFTSFVPVGNNPGVMDISPDGQYLYVSLRGTASIQRLSLPSLSSDLIIPLGTRSDGSPLYAKELHVSPVAPHTVAVVRSATATASGSEYDLAVFDDAVMRNHVVGGGITSDHATTFQWDSGARIFAVDSSSSNGTAYRIGIDANGAQTTARQDGVTTYDGDAHLVNGKMYMQSGRVFDPLTFAQLGAFPISIGGGGGVMTADPTTGKAFFLGANELQSYDLNSLAAVASTPLGATNPSFVTHLVRWGYDGLALLNPNSGIPGILLFNGPFIRP